MRMWNCRKRRAGVSFVILDLPPPPEAPRRGLEGPAPSLPRGRSSTRRSGAAFWSLLRDARVLLCVALAALIALLPVPTAVAQDSAPVVSPDRIEDAPAIKPDPYPDFDNFAWRAFIALNWPSLTDPAHRGEPDRAKTLGDLRSGEPVRNGCRQSRQDARDLHALHGFQPVRFLVGRRR